MESGSSVDLSYPSKSDSDSKTEKTQDKSRIESVKFIPVRCSYEEEKNGIRIHYSQGVITANLEDFMSRRKLRKFKDSYIEGNISYLTCLRLRHKEGTSVYIHSLSTNKSDALRSKKRVQKIADLYNNIYYRELDEDSDTIQFGLGERIRKKSKIIYNIISNLGKLLRFPSILIPTSALLVAVLYGGNIVKGISILLLSLVFMSFAITSWIKFRTFNSVRTYESSVIKREYNSQHRILLADIEDKDDRKILRVNDIDASWSFNKNDFGDLCGYEEKVYNRIDKIDGDGKKAIIRVKPNVAGIDGLKSDEGEYVLPQFDKNKRWIV